MYSIFAEHDVDSQSSRVNFLKGLSHVELYTHIRILFIILEIVEPL